MNKVYFRIAAFLLAGLIGFGASAFAAEQKGTRAEQKTSTAASDKVAADGHHDSAGVAYDKFDLNHDGQVTREEVNPSNARSQEAFEQADKNRDGKLDAEEFREFYMTLMVAAAGGTTSAAAALGAQRETMKPDRETGIAQRVEETERRSAAEFFEDAWITLKVNSALLADDQVRSRQISVDTHQNMVTLRGNVENQAQVSQAQKIASAIAGVKSVNNKLGVAPVGETETR